LQNTLQTFLPKYNQPSNHKKPTEESKQIQLELTSNQSSISSEEGKILEDGSISLEN